MKDRWYNKSWVVITGIIAFLCALWWAIMAIPYHMGKSSRDDEVNELHQEIERLTVQLDSSIRITEEKDTVINLLHGDK